METVMAEPLNFTFTLPLTVKVGSQPDFANQLITIALANITLADLRILADAISGTVDMLTVKQCLDESPAIDNGGCDTAALAHRITQAQKTSATIAVETER